MLQQIRYERTLNRIALGRPQVIDGDFALPPETKLACDLIVKGNLILGEGARLDGNVKALGSITLESPLLLWGILFQT